MTPRQKARLQRVVAAFQSRRPQREMVIARRTIPLPTADDWAALVAAFDAPEIVDFDAEDVVTVSGRGTLLVGRCPIRVLRAAPLAYLRKVRARGKVYEVRAVERHATMSEWIEVGAPIGVLIGKEIA